MRPSDALLLQRLMNEPAVLEAVGERPSRLLFWQDCLRTWCADPDEANYAVLEGETGVPLGWLGLHGLLRNDRTVAVKMLALLPPFWGKGYGAAALRLTVPWLRADSHERLLVDVLQTNARGLAFCERHGFVLARSLRRRAGANGEMRTVRVMERAL